MTMKPTHPFEDFWLSSTHAREVDPGTEELIHVSGGDSQTPWVTSTGRYLLVYCSTFGELVQLFNASEGGADSMGAQYLKEWPWSLLLEEPPVATSANRRPFTFPTREVAA